MLIEIDLHSGVPIFRQLMDQVRRQILAGHIAEGAQLPSVRDLAEQLKINPMTVSKTYSLLEIEGLVERRRGVGLFVVDGAGGQSNKLKMQLLEELVKKAAVSAVQFSISETDAISLFQKHFRKLSSNSRRIS